MYVIRNNESGLYWFGFKRWTDNISHAYVYKEQDEAKLRANQLSQTYGPSESVRKQLMVFNPNTGYITYDTKRVSSVGIKQT